MNQLSSKDQLIAYLAAQGYNNTQIAEAADCSPSTVSVKLSDEKIQFEAKLLRYKLYGKDHKKRFSELLPQAIDVAEEVLNATNAKPQTRLNAANAIMNRALGMPKQTIEHEGSLIRSLLDKLDKIEPQEKEVIQIVEYAEESEHKALVKGTNPNAFIDVDTVNNPNESKVDEWVKNNL